MTEIEEMLELANKIDERDQMIVLSPRERDLIIAALRAQILQHQPSKPFAQSHKLHK